MKELKTTECYVPVSVKERLPENTETVFILMNKETWVVGDKDYTYPSTPMSAYYTNDGWCWEYGELMNLDKNEEVTHWLEKRIGYFLSEEDFDKMTKSKL